MFLLDTNVLSEVLQPRPSPLVIHRLLQYTAGELFASELPRYELRFGAALRPNVAVFWERLERELLPLVDVAASDRRGQPTRRQYRRSATPGRPA